MKQKLSDIEKENELKELRSILMATLDYNIEKHSPMGIEFTNHFEKLKTEVEEHFEKKRLTRLKVWLKCLTEEPRETEDFNYQSYIKEKTGFEIDIFANFRKRIDKIIKRKKIRNEHEYRDVESMVDQLCQQQIVDNAKIDLLNALLSDYYITTEPKSLF